MGVGGGGGGGVVFSLGLFDYCANFEHSYAGH